MFKIAFLEFATAKPTFSKITNGQIGVTVKSADEKKVMGYFLVNPDSSITIEPEEHEKVYLTTECA